MQTPPSLAMLTEHPHSFLLLWLAGLFLMERFLGSFPLPHATSLTGLRRLTTGIAFGVIHHALLSPLVALPLLMWSASLGLWRWPAWVPGWALLVLSVLLLDLAGYWLHRASHRYAFLWRFHQVHHLDEHMDVTTGLRVHFSERLMHAGIAAITVVAFSLPLSGVLLHGILGQLLAVFHHSNVRVPRWLEGMLGPIIITPAFHYPHHHEQKRDTNSNYGFMVPWWDRLFGTHNRRRRTRGWRMGLDYSADLGLAGLLREPFRRPPLWARKPRAQPDRPAGKG